MNKALAIIAALLVASIAMYTLRKSARDARNERAVERIFSGSKMKPGDNVQPGFRPRSTDGSTQGGAIRTRP